MNLKVGRITKTKRDEGRNKRENRKDMTKLKLIINERLAIIRFLNETYQRGGLDLVGLNQAMKLMKKIEITEEEQKKINWRIDYQLNQIKWDKDKDIGNETEITSDEIKLIKEMIEAKNKGKGFTIADGVILLLFEKLKKNENEK